MKELPVNTGYFQEIIDNDLLYIDKTQYIYDFLKKYKCCFLSRPRRFGKSLVLSTLEAIFEGDRKPFKGLWIDSSDYEFKKYPVIQINLNLDFKTPDVFENHLVEVLKDIASDEGLAIVTENPGLALSRLIRYLSSKYGQKVVILIDEYDKPVLKYLHDQALAQKFCDILMSFYGPLKNDEKYIHKVFITGVTKTALATASGSINNLTDLSLLPEYACLCGFTLAELKKYFSDRTDLAIDGLKSYGALPPSASVKELWDIIIAWYDGYNFGGSERVFNPWSILNFFSDLVLENYWMATGPSYFLTEYIKKNPIAFSETSLKQYTAKDLNLTNLNSLAPVPLLYQYGYLTIDEVSTNSTHNKVYSFKVPNFEVAYYYRAELLEGLFGVNPRENDQQSADFKKAILERDATKLEQMFRSALGSATHHKQQKKAKESYYHDLIQIYLYALDLFSQSEVKGSIGQSDLVLSFPGEAGSVFVIIEVKFIAPSEIDPEDKESDVEISSHSPKPLPSKSKTPKEIKKTSEVPADRNSRVQKLIKRRTEEALKQIDEKGYIHQYEYRAEKVFKIALVIYDRSFTSVTFAKEMSS